MNVTIIAPDNRIAVDGEFRTVPCDLPGIVAVRFDGETARIEHTTDEPSTLTAEEFQATYGALVTAWGEAPSDDQMTRQPAAPATADEMAALKAQLAAVTEALAIIRKNTVGG